MLALCPSCVRESVDDPLTYSVLINAEADQWPTRTVLDEDLNVNWLPDDKVMLLSQDGKISMLSSECVSSGTKGTFVVDGWPRGTEPRYLVAGGSEDGPYAEVNGRYIKGTICPSQTISDNASFGRTANLAIGQLTKTSDGSYRTSMKNACALVKFRIEELDNIQKIILKDASGQAIIAGEFDIYMEDGIPSIRSVVEGSSSVLATMSDDRAFPEGTYYICIRPDVDFVPEFRMILSDGRVLSIVARNSIHVQRSGVLDLGTIDFYTNELETEVSVSNENFTSGEILGPSFWESKLTADCHPRLVFSDEDFEKIKTLKDENEAVMDLHTCIMTVADAAVADDKPLEYVKDASNKRILDVSRTALEKLLTCAYAYKVTGDAKYLQKAIQNITQVCSFNDWNPDHYLDVAEMSAAVSLTYDWLYHDFDASTKELIVKALHDYALSTSRMSKYTWWYDRIGNWNQVCNSGLVCAAYAIYEHYPTLAQSVIDEAINTNRIAVEGIYGPDGAYPEGPTYWSYGTIYQILMMTVMETVQGRDYGLSLSPGFMETGTFKIFSSGSLGTNFNFADNALGGNSNYPLWYFAAKKNDTGLLYRELQLVKNTARYVGSDHKGLLTLMLKYAMTLDCSNVTGFSKKFYSAQGNTPMMMCRSGWDKLDHYLGIKGGQDGYLHGHMDGGSFVYDAHGVRWAMDYVRQNYAEVETGIQNLGGKLSDYSQNSLRWKLFRLNCRQHNTLTVNDKDHNVDAFVRMTAVENTSSRMSATFDLTPLFDGDLEIAQRTAAICNESYLEIKDVLKAPSNDSAHVRWTMVSNGVPEITSEGIRLSKSNVTMLLKTTGADVTYKIWSSDPQDYDSPLKHLDAANPNTYICGYEIDIPEGETFTLVTTLKKI